MAKILKLIPGNSAAWAGVRKKILERGGDLPLAELEVQLRDDLLSSRSIDSEDEEDLGPMEVVKTYIFEGGIPEALRQHIRHVLHRGIYAVPVIIDGRRHPAGFVYTMGRVPHPGERVQFVHAKDFWMKFVPAELDDEGNMRAAYFISIFRVECAR